MKNIKIMFLTFGIGTSILFGAEAPPTAATRKPNYFSQLPAELRGEVLQYAFKGTRYPDPKALANTIIASDSKITPQALLALLESLPVAVAITLADHLKNEPIVKDPQISAWISNAPTQLINGQFLFNAVDKKNKEHIQKLLENEFIDVNWRNTASRSHGEGLTPLLHAMNIRMSTQSATEIIDLLLQAGANPNLASHEKDPTTGGFRNWTALIAAASRGIAPIVEMLLKANADVDQQDNQGDTALMEATKNNYVPIIKILLAAKANPAIKNNEGKTARDLTLNPAIQQLLDAAMPRIK